jgi:sugar/nucleoside kinase (ribokinase family)
MIVSVGDVLVDIVCSLRDPLRRGTDAFSTNEIRQGGSAANVAAAVARLGAPVRFVGSVGLDAFGEFLVDALTVAGVTVCAPIISGATTGTVVVLVEPDGERTMAPDRGASARLAPASREWLEGADVVHIPLYAFEVEPLASTATTLAGWAHDMGVSVSLDLSAVSLLEKLGAERLAALAAELRPDLVFANRDEAVAAGPFRDAPIFVEKNGADPVRCFRYGSFAVSVPVPEVANVYDTTGAGDSFAAGFLTGFAAGDDLEGGCRRGSAAAAKLLSSTGQTV